jgi:imidazole glycerol-phosphate synthase subunit HisH
MENICILDYGTGNIHSLKNILSKLSIPFKYSNKVKDIKNATHLILPGVGAFDVAYKNANTFLPMEIIFDEIFNKSKPILGICVGMQIMASYGEEGEGSKGFNWIEGNVTKIKSNNLSLPHVGWNNILKVKNSIIVDGLHSDDFYFLNSYYFNVKNKEHIVAYTKYESKFPSIVQNKNIFGVQFHPEKSQMNGKKILLNFIKIKNYFNYKK